LVERMTVNHDVAGSSPAGGATVNQQTFKFAGFFFNICICNWVSFP
jgi:hypothetical protein